MLIPTKYKSITISKINLILSKSLQCLEIITMPWNGRETIAMFNSSITSTLLFPRAVHGGRYKLC